jgi:hypothetical protein
MTFEEHDKLQMKYHQWQKAGMDLSIDFTYAIKSLMSEILDNYHNGNDPDLRAASKIEILNNNTFETAWIDNEGRPCCTAMIDDGAPIGWRVEFLDFYNKQELHKELLEELGEVKMSHKFEIVGSYVTCVNDCCADCEDVEEMHGKVVVHINELETSLSKIKDLAKELICECWDEYGKKLPTCNRCKIIELCKSIDKDVGEL